MDHLKAPLVDLRKDPHQNALIKVDLVDPRPKHLRVPVVLKEVKAALEEVRDPMEVQKEALGQAVAKEVLVKVVAVIVVAA